MHQNTAMCIKNSPQHSPLGFQQVTAQLPQPQAAQLTPNPSNLQTPKFTSPLPKQQPSIQVIRCPSSIRPNACTRFQPVSQPQPLHKQPQPAPTDESLDQSTRPAGATCSSNQTPHLQPKPMTAFNFLSCGHALTPSLQSDQNVK